MPGPGSSSSDRPLRDVADEIVVAADSRAGQDDLDAYASACDRLLRIEYQLYERHLGWMHAQCRGDWILRVDGDELLAPALVRQLPELTRRRDVHQYVMPRRWLYPDGKHWLDELPWWPDYQIRLVRNDAQLRFRGADHTAAEPVRPALCLGAPAAALEFLTASIEHRENKVRRYDATAPDLVAPGGGVHAHRFYLPERYAEHEPVPLPRRKQPPRPRCSLRQSGGSRLSRPPIRCPWPRPTAASAAASCPRRSAPHRSRPSRPVTSWGWGSAARCTSLFATTAATPGPGTT